MLLVNIHELQVILADPILLDTLKHQVDDIRGIFGLEGKNIVGLGSAEDFGERVEIDAQRNVAITAEGREGLGPERHGHESNVRVVHGLQGDSRVIAVEVAVLDKTADSVDDLKFVSVLATTASICGGGGIYPLQNIRLFQSCLKHCEKLASRAERGLVTKDLLLTVDMKDK
jgi:hypothetical protein